MAMKKRIVIGEYNHYGYTLFEATGIKELYSAGNHIEDSGLFVSIGSRNCLELKDIRKFCIQTGKEMAAELGYKWGGASRIADDSYGGGIE
jgi:hypothetical protein